MARSRWIYINGVGIPADDHEALAAARGHAEPSGTVHIMPDLPDFVSPIDGQRYSGRAGMREHCLKHNVVPTADLAGLPPKTYAREHTPSKREVAARKENLSRIIDSHLG